MSGWCRTFAMVLVASSLAGCAPIGGRPRTERVSVPLAVYGSTATIEIAPVLLAARDHFPDATITNGGIGNLVGAAAAGFGESGLADIATHAETQALRYSVDHPEIRIILTVTEGRYRIVARRSAGIERLADLKGKRIATLATTSSGYFLARMLARAGLTFDDVEPVRISPIEGMSEALESREVDAVAIWEPHATNAAHVLGDDRVEFSGDGVYRELFNINATAASLADPVKRRKIVAFVRAVMDASAAIRVDPVQAQTLVAKTSGFARDDVARAWSTLSFPAALPPDLLDVLEAEEAWLATRDGRPARSRDVLSRLIDDSVYQEALRR